MVCIDEGLRAGLSPLARGTPAAASSFVAMGRFIPAGAGNTATLRHQRNRPPVYPRWRGEHEDVGFNPFQLRGLSPLARGTRHRDDAVQGVYGFIPAGAGNTSVVKADSVTGSVYPRWRGEHADSDTPVKPEDGLSPLARGTPPDSNING